MEQNVKVEFNKGRAIFTAAAFGLAVAATAAQPARADWSDCRYRIERARDRLDYAIDRYGYWSWQAQDRRRDLNNTRNWCWRAHRGWWDYDEHEWREDHW